MRGISENIGVFYRRLMKVKTKYVCQTCGYSTLRWSGKCPDCDSWNSLVEEIRTDDKRKKPTSKNIRINEGSFKALSEIASQNESRIATNIVELDRVLGGGIVEGSVLPVCG